MYPTNRADTNTLTQLIKDVLVCLSFPLDRYRGQCYNVASNMDGLCSVFELAKVFKYSAKKINAKSWPFT